MARGALHSRGLRPRRRGLHRAARQPVAPRPGALPSPSARLRLRASPSRLARRARQEPPVQGRDRAHARGQTLPGPRPQAARMPGRALRAIARVMRAADLRSLWPHRRARRNARGIAHKRNGRRGALRRRQHQHNRQRLAQSAGRTERTGQTLEHQPLTPPPRTPPSPLNKPRACA